MKVARFLLILGLISACASAEAQRGRPEYPYLRHARTYLRFGVHDGRIAVGVLKTSTYSPPPAGSRDRKEQVAVHYDYQNGSAAFHYQLSSPDENVTVKAGTNGHVVAQSEPGLRSRAAPSEFVQPASGPLMLTVGRDAEKKTYTAPTIWHLLLAHRELCREHVIPLLRIMRPDWPLVDQADGLEKTLLELARRGRIPDERRWAALVAALGAEEYARREAADRELRAIGPAVVSYLKGIPRDKLDAEQQYRVHRIIQSLTDARGDESARQIAAAMLADPTIWLVLLERDSIETRQLVAGYLQRLVREPIDFYPAADPPTRARQLETLRRRFTR
ncbi:MAG: hypothetical protein JW719_01345 [Pirellulales bacterium]|nr:hypothetical protein [Pirellulales bacterium]